jgi:hypothetical protein
MTTPSSASETGITLEVFTPLVQGEEPIGSITSDVDSYTHSIAANGGYMSASFTINGNRETVEDWVEFGLGRHVRAHAPDGRIIWEGFVDTVSATIGGITTTRGPLVNICNRVSVMYTPIIENSTGTSTTQPITGTPTETVIVQDTDSQRKYGIWEKVINSGNMLPDDAEFLRDLFLVENAYPDGNCTISFGGETNSLSVTVTCKGYIEWLGYVYNDVTLDISTTVTAKLEDVIDADPNNLFSSTASATTIDTNMVLAHQWEDQNRTAITIINELVSYGGGSDDRWLFGIYGNRIVHFNQAPTAVEYVYYVLDNSQHIETMTGETIHPWDILPGKWISMLDLMYGSTVTSIDAHGDTRSFFIEQVDFTAPNTVSINGQKVRKLPQYLARMGLGGV